MSNLSNHSFHQHTKELDRGLNTVLYLYICYFLLVPLSMWFWWFWSEFFPSLTNASRPPLWTNSCTKSLSFWKMPFKEKRTLLWSRPDIYSSLSVRFKLYAYMQACRPCVLGPKYRLPMIDFTRSAGCWRNKRLDRALKWKIKWRA